MIPQFCRMQPEMIPEELSEWNGIWRLIPKDARISRIKKIKEFWLELFEVLMYL